MSVFSNALANIKTLLIRANLLADGATDAETEEAVKVLLPKSDTNPLPPPKPEPTELEKQIAAAIEAQVKPLQAEIAELKNRPNGAVQLFSQADVEKAGGMEKLQADYAASQKRLAAARDPFAA